MVRSRVFWSVILAASIIAVSSTLAIAYTFNYDPSITGSQPSKWDPGVETASFFDPAAPPGSPGGATWSVMSSGIGITLGQKGNHPTAAVSSDLSALEVGLPDVGGVPYAEWAIGAALDVWAAASGFTNLGKVTDGGGFNGDPATGHASNSGLGDGTYGDIRVGAYSFGLGSGDSVILADGFQPGTTALTGSSDAWGSIGGDIHINNDSNPSTPNQLIWVDNEAATGAGTQYDLFTDILHEIGHALGLGHTDAPGSVMQLYSVRGTGQRSLGTDDMAGIQAIYGRPAQTNGNIVPEPTTLILLGSGVVCLAGMQRRRKEG